MTVILTAAGLIMVAAGGFITFQNNATNERIEDVKARVHDIEQNYLRKDEHLEFKMRTDANFGRIDHQLETVQGEIVPRGEHEERWRAIDAQIAVVQRQADKTASELESNYTLGDKLKELQHEIDVLQELRHEKAQ
jgi:ribosome-associated translation inhibitor RaiA